MPETPPITTRLRNECLLRLRRHPALFFPLIRHRQARGHNRALKLPDAQTDVLIEGYFRCANHYAVGAMRLAHGESLRVAGHSHAPAVVKRACALGVPVILLIREPVAVTLSNLLKHPTMTPGYTLRGYVDFYKQVLPLHEQVVIGAFDEVTANFNAVIDRLNARFRTSFQHVPDNEQTLEALGKQRPGPADPQRPLSGPGVADLPTPQKEQAKADARARLEHPRLQPLIQRAQDLYRRYLEIAQRNA